MTEPSVPASRPERRHFAEDDYLTRFPPGSPQEILIDSGLEKLNWKERVPASSIRPMFPGTAILFEGRYYEIIRKKTRPGKKSRYLYALNPWPESLPIRVQFHYTPEFCTQERRRAAAEREEGSVGTALKGFSPLVGLLPREDQIRIGNRYGIAPVQLTYLSGFFCFFLGALSLVLGLVSMLAPEWLVGVPVVGHMSTLLFVLVGVYLCVESLVRMIATKHDEPAGNLVVSFFVEAYRTLRRQFDPSYHRERFEKMEGGKASVFLNAKDEIRRVDDTDYEVLSLLPKPEWSSMTGISYNNRWYVCAQSGSVKNADPPRYRFLLREAPLGTVFRSTYTYTEDDVRDRYRQKRKQDLGTWVETFSPIWGLLDGDVQKELGRVYGFNAMKYTAWTIAALGVVGVANVIVSAMNFLSHTAGSAEGFWLLGGGYLALETVLRLRLWLRNEPSGSILGVLLKPLAAKLLKV